jgi:hypothetical protein
MAKFEADEDPILRRGPELLFTFFELRQKKLHPGRPGCGLKKNCPQACRSAPAPSPGRHTHSRHIVCSQPTSSRIIQAKLGFAASGVT